MPIHMVGPDFMENVFTDMRRHYQGPLRLARDLRMR